MTKRLKHFILVADDDEDLRIMICEFLEMEGYVVAQAESVKDALSKVTKANRLPDLVLTDFSMAGSGITLARKYSALQVPVIMMSSTPKAAREELSEVGLDYLPILGKGFGIDYLLHAIRTNLR